MDGFVVSNPGEKSTAWASELAGIVSGSRVPLIYDRLPPATPRPTIYKWMEMVISNHFLYKDLVHHPIDSQPFINSWVLGVPGTCPTEGNDLLPQKLEEVIGLDHADSAFPLVYLDVPGRKCRAKSSKWLGLMGN